MNAVDLYIFMAAAIFGLIVTTPIYIWSEWYTKQVIKKYQSRENCWED